MLPVVRDLYVGIEKLKPTQEIFVEARHLRAVGVSVSQEKKWVEKDPTTGEGDFEMVDVPDTRPIAIEVGQLRAALDVASKPVEVTESKAAAPVVDAP